MDKIEVGQVIYVEMRAMFSRSNHHGLSEYKVTKINSKSIYAEKINSDCPLKLRFDKKTMVHDGGMGFLYKAYIKEEDYWNKIREEEEKEKLKYEINKSLSSLGLEKLKEIKKIIKSCDSQIV